MKATVFAVLGMVAACAGCAPKVNIPGVNEPLASSGWTQCAKDAENRESMALIDDLTLDAPRLLCRGVALAGIGKLDPALEALDEAGMRDKNDYRPLFLAGRILAEAGRYEEALGAFERANKRASNIAVPTETLGTTIEAKDGPEAARRFLAMADGRGLCNYNCEGVLGRLHQQAKAFAQAEQVYRGMIGKAPDEPTAYVGLAALANANSDFEAETEQLELATNVKGFAKLSAVQRAEVLHSLAFALYNNKKYNEAARPAADALNLDGERAEWHVLAGWIDLKRDRPERALVAFDHAKAKDRRLVAACVGEGDALLALGRVQEASAAYAKALELEPGSGVILLKSALTKAKSFDREGALLLVDEAKNKDPSRLPRELMEELSNLLPPAAPPSAAPAIPYATPPLPSIPKAAKP